MSSTSRSYLQHYNGYMKTTKSGLDPVAFIPIVQTLKGITLGNGNN